MVLKFLKDVTFSHEGTLLQYPVAKITESISRFSPLTSSTPVLENFLIPGTIWIFPDLIFCNAPISRTGVFPWVFLSSIGPITGLFIPYFSKFPRLHLARINRILSTTFTGNHFINEDANSNVDFPEVSLGKTWTCGFKPKELRNLSSLNF